jgi:hypothetical protein
VSPFVIIVILTLTVLFIVLSVMPLLLTHSNMDSSRRFPAWRTKTAHYRALRNNSNQNPVISGPSVQERT